MIHDFEVFNQAANIQAADAFASLMGPAPDVRSMAEHACCSSTCFAPICFIGNQIGFLDGQGEAYIENGVLRTLKDTEDLIALAELVGIKYLLPIDLDEQRLVTSNRTFLEAYSVRFLLSDWETISICDQKDRFYRFMQEQGFANLVPRVLTSLKPPCVVKKSEDNWGKNCFLVTNERKEAEFRKQASSDEYIIQEYIPGDHEYATHVLFSRGCIQHAVSFRHQHSSDYYIQGIKDDGLSTEKVDTPDVLKSVFSSILSALGYQGLACIDYKIDSNGVPKIFEINPRVGASLGVRKAEFEMMLAKYQFEASLTERESSVAV